MTSIALTSIAERAADFPTIQRKNQLSKLSWFASDMTDIPFAKDATYLIC